MAAAAQGAEGPSLPRSVLVIGVPLAGVVLVAFFLFLGFPWNVLGQRITAELERSQGVRVSFDNLGPALTLAGPGLEAQNARLELPDGDGIELTRALVRPAWSLSWLRADPAIYMELEGPSGSAFGTVVLGQAAAWDGRFEQLDLSRLPLADSVPRGGLQGFLDATADVVLGENGPEGPVEFEVKEGSVSLPALPVAIPFERLSGNLRFGGESYLVLENVTLEGPIVSGKGGGSVAHAKSLEQAALQLDFELDVKPALAGAVRSAGIRVNSKGSTRVRVSGTVANPRIR